MNKVSIFSNGIADFQRTFKVEKGKNTEIQIPVKATHIADVLASLSVWGDVTVIKPPTYKPSNESDGNLDINSFDVIKDLASKLSGTSVKISTIGNLNKKSTCITGILVGLHEYTKKTTMLTDYVVSTPCGLVNVNTQDVDKFEFLDESVNSEISKALQRNYQKIKPNSTFVSLVLGTNKEFAEGIVQYTVPAAAWKISYRLRETNGKVKLQAFAVVDNNTDEDWNDFKMSFVTGEPVTFETDLAEAKIPSRKKKNIVKAQAVDGYMVESGMKTPKGSMMRSMAFAASAPNMELECSSAFVSDYENKEVGDFTVFESDSIVTIAANRSAVVPVMSVALNDAKTISHYKYDNNATRPYRCMSIKNDTNQSLGDGVGTIYIDGVFSGSAIIPAMKQGEEKLIPHALDTSVKVVKKTSNKNNNFTSIVLTKGLRKTVKSVECTTQYFVTNLRNKKELLLEHDYNLNNPTVKTTLDGVLLKEKDHTERGIRYSFNLEKDMLLEVKETKLEESVVNLSSDLRWMDGFKVFEGNKNISKLLELKKKINEKEEEHSSCKEKIQKLSGQQNRLRENIKVLGSEAKAEWIEKLDSSENKITEIENKMDSIEKQKQELESKLEVELQNISEEWHDFK